MIKPKKNIIITGGAGRIGFSVAKKLLDKNYNCLIADINKTYLENVSLNLDSRGLKTFQCDLTSSEEIESLIIAAEEYFGDFQGVVHCAYPKPEKWGSKFEDLSEKDLKESLFMQLGSAILLSQKVIKSFKKYGGGNLIHISSIQGISAPKFEHYEGTNMSSPIEYSAIKSGVIAITKWLAKKYKNMNIRVNCVSPGGILDNQPIKFLEKYRESCTNIGMLSADQVSSIIEFILSNDSHAINGQNIVVDDGWSL